MNELDRSLFLMANGSPASSGMVVALAVVLARYVVLLVPLHMALVWVGGSRSMRFVALAGLLALVTALAVNQALGLVVYRPRPFLVGLGTALIEHRDSSSLPSNHATIFFAYAAALALFSRWGLATTFGGIGLLVAWSRVFLGIHYPLDMAAAAATSAASAFAATWIMARSGTRLLLLAESLYEPALARASQGRARFRAGR